MERCNECNAPRTQGRCLICKSNEYFRSKGVVIDTRCTRCDTMTRLYSNGQCGACLKVQGLKECSNCHEIGVELLAFHPKQRICKTCRHPLAHLTPAQQTLHKHLKQTYKIGLDQYLALAEKQGGLCAICQKKPKTRLVVDHDHTTGRVRGLLCGRCNPAIGMLMDSASVAQRAATYLAQSNDRVVPDTPEPAPSRTEFDRRLLQAEIRALEDALEDARIEKARILATAATPDRFGAVVRAFIDVLNARKLPTERARARSVAWLESLLTPSAPEPTREPVQQEPVAPGEPPMHQPPSG